MRRDGDDARDVAVFCPFRANGGAVIPRALPWAGLWPPFRAMRAAASPGRTEGVCRNPKRQSKTWRNSFGADAINEMVV